METIFPCTDAVAMDTIFPLRRYGHATLNPFGFAIGIGTLFAEQQSAVLFPLQ
jgi:hypothetical protein